MKSIAKITALIAVISVLGGCATAGTTREAKVADFKSLLGGGFRNATAALQNTPSSGKAKITSGELMKLSPAQRITLAEAHTLDFSEMLVTCNVVLTRFEARADKERHAEFWTAIVGTLAGAVVVPALAAKASAAKSAIAGWGGLAGATNSAQQLMRNTGLDAASTIVARQKVIENMTKATEAYIKAGPDDVEAKQDAIASGLAACVAYEVTASKDVAIDVPK